MENEALALAVIGHAGTEHVRTPHAIQRSLGGAAYYVALGARCMGAQVGIVSRVGRDYPLRDLQRLGVDTTGVHVADGETSHFQIDYLPDFDSRHVQIALGVGADIRGEDFPKAYGPAPFVHVGTNLPENQLAIIHGMRHRVKGLIAVDCFDQFIREDPMAVVACIAEADLYFVNEAEAALLKGVSLPIKPHVIKRGAQGAEYIDTTRRVVVSAPVVPLVDPTGAGDIFAGAFLAGIALGMPMPDIMRMACGHASRSVTAFGATGILRSIRSPLTR